jgi:sugar/nucleoside kinase (ribokinase family)
MKFLLSIFLAMTISLSSYEVLTISDAVIDYLVNVDEEFMEQMPGRQGGTDFVDVTLFQDLLTRAGSKPVKLPGGSGANMVKGLARLGHDCAVVAYVGDDEEGVFFRGSLVDCGIDPLLEKCELPTGRIASFIAPDKSRTMRSLRGAADAIADHTLDEELFSGLKLFHLEGYKLPYPHIAKRATQLAKEAGALVSMDVASFELAEKYHSFIFDLLEGGHVDVFFANEKEAETLVKLAPEKAAVALSQYCQIAVVTMGKEGGWVASGDKLIRYGAYETTTVDETGAGDLFMSGFLHGVLSDHELEKCADNGAVVASYVVRQIGAEIPWQYWPLRDLP